MSTNTSNNRPSNAGVPGILRDTNRSENSKTTGQSAVDIPNVLPHEKVFPIQIGSELFRLSGASISSDGMCISTAFRFFPSCAADEMKRIAWYWGRQLDMDWKCGVVFNLYVLDFACWVWRLSFFPGLVLDFDTPCPRFYYFKSIR
jgi:hypothetical protein